MRKRKCKQCKEWFEKQKPLQFVCSPECAVIYSKRLSEKKAKKELSEEKKRIKNEKHEWNERKKNLSVDLYPRKNKKYFQDAINMLARAIDKRFGHVTCIDCSRGFEKQTDGAHFHSVGSDSSVRFNLHNIHSARSDCNKYSDKHHEGYKLGLAERYGKDYLDFVQSLPQQYTLVKISNLEIVEKTKLARAIFRTFDTYVFEDSIDARTKLNKLIGIYNN